MSWVRWLRYTLTSMTGDGAAVTDTLLSAVYTAPNRLSEVPFCIRTLVEGIWQSFSCFIREPLGAFEQGAEGGFGER